jgi:hypothetical protein
MRLARTGASRACRAFGLKLKCSTHQSHWWRDSVESRHFEVILWNRVTLAELSLSGDQLLRVASIKVTQSSPVALKSFGTLLFVRRTR